METRIDTRRESENFMPPRTLKWQKEHPYEPSPQSFPHPLPLVSQADLVNPLLTAGDLAEKGGPACDSTLPLSEAIGMLTQAESGVLPVVSGGRPVGLLTERDVVAAVAKNPRDYARLAVNAVMSHRWSVIAEDARLEELFHTFSARGVMVVDRQGRLQGMIYWRNLADNFSERGLGRVLLRLFERENGRSC